MKTWIELPLRLPRKPPSTLHLWWARRPLAAARAVIFAQMVDDPSAHPDLFKTEKAQERERQRLFRIIEDLVLWENMTNEAVLEKARAEIWQSWRRACAENADHPRAKELIRPHEAPGLPRPLRRRRGLAARGAAPRARELRERLEPGRRLGAVRDGLELITWERDAFAYAESFDEETGRYRGLRARQNVSIGVSQLASVVFRGRDAPGTGARLRPAR